MLLKIDHIDLSPLKKNQSQEERKILLFPFQLLIIIFEVRVSSRKPFKFVLLKELKSSSIHLSAFFSSPFGMAAYMEIKNVKPSSKTMKIPSVLMKLGIFLLLLNRLSGLFSFIYT